MAFFINMQHTGYFYIGYITKTRGLKGEIQLFFEYPAYEDLELDVIFIEIDAKPVPYFVSSFKRQSNATAYLFLEDVNHIDEAKKLVRNHVFIREDKKPEKAAGEFLISDVKGFTVVDKTNGELGKITDVHAYPQQHVAVVMVGAQEMLFPLNDDFIVELDVVNSVIYVDLPEGLLDVYLK